jgi:hypothetical protein
MEGTAKFARNTMVSSCVAHIPSSSYVLVHSCIDVDGFW